MSSPVPIRSPLPALQTLLHHRQPTPDLDATLESPYPRRASESPSIRLPPMNAHPLSSRLPHPSTPLPLAKILPLLFSRISEGLIYSVCFPYINEMIRGFGVEEKRVGVWSALAEAALMVTEAISAPFFAPISNRYGRKPIFLACLFLWGVFAIGFGLVKDVWWAIVIRACLGVLSGCGVLSRTMMGELCDKSNRIRGFAIFSPALTLGVTIGPLVGGFLANPVPRLVTWDILVKYPYLLPAIVAGLWTFAAFAFGVSLLPETLPSSLRRSKSEHSLEKASRNGGVGELLRHKPFQKTLMLYGLNNAVMFSWEAVYPLFAFTSRELGGLGLPTHTIGVVLAFSAGLSIVMTAVLFPRLHRALPENLYLRLCLTAYPLAVLFFPLLWAANYGSERMGVAVWAILAAQMFLRRIGDFSATMLDTIVLDTIPGPEHLVMANSVTFSMAAVWRAFGPFLVSWFFSLSTTYASPFSVGRQLVWVVFFLGSFPSVWLAYGIHTPDDSEKEWSSEEQYELLGDIDGAAADDLVENRRIGPGSA